jgi:predicted nucleic acid-binding Zn ribbon protein
MSFRTVSDIIGALQARGYWQAPPLQILLNCWHEIVGNTIVLHTRPIFIQRDVLYVATSSAAWAQTLTFERKNLLANVNRKLLAPSGVVSSTETTEIQQTHSPLTDIRFSTAGWNSCRHIIKPKRPTHTEHPCYLEHNSFEFTEKGIVANDGNAVNMAFDRWAKKVQISSLNQPLCPQCQSPAPEGEVQRWGVCALCAAKRF